MSNPLAAALKAARVVEARQALKTFLDAYPEAYELLAEMVKPQQSTPPTPAATLGLPPPFPPDAKDKGCFQRKLSDQDVQAIRARLVAGDKRLDIANDFGIVENSVYSIGRGKMRANVPMSPEFREWLSARGGPAKRGPGRPKKRK